MRYYIHYEDFNRRMDEWITIDRILKFPSEGNRLEKEKKKADEINQILNEGHSNSASIPEFRDPPARKRLRSESATSSVGSGMGKENTVPLQLPANNAVASSNAASTDNDGEHSHMICC